MIRPICIASVFWLLVFVNQRILATEDFGIDNYANEQNAYIEQVIKKNHLKGLSIAFFTNDSVIWKNCFGKSTYGKPINDSTLFSIQSMSKNFTAMAVMFAVQDGLVDLDTPVIRYLPDFRVNSCFETSPEERITLRMLLSHTAGFTHEAPSGNNYDYSPVSKQEHWCSMRDTWLKFPAGTNYSYSNLGFDLAAQIIQKVSGIDFETYMKEKIFLPLGMKHTTIDDHEFVSNSNKTEGTIPSLKKRHFQIPLIGSGAVYSCLSDLVKYVQFQLNFGSVNGKQLLQREFLKEMYQYHANNYGLGIQVGDLSSIMEQYDTYFLNHNGGGYGYGSSMTWLPEYNLGFVVLGNKPFGYGEIILKPFDDFMSGEQRIEWQADLTKGFRPDFTVDTFRTRAFEFVYSEDDAGGMSDRKGLIGKYKVLQNVNDLKWYVKFLRFLRINTPQVKVTMRDGILFMDGYFGFNELREYRPGLFFTKYGEAFDARSGSFTFRNIQLKKF